MAAAGVRIIAKGQGPGKPGAAIHEMETVHMGTDPRTSVLNKYNQAHDVPNLFVTDGAAMASSATQNPSLTCMALSARAAGPAGGPSGRRSAGASGQQPAVVQQPVAPN